MTVANQHRVVECNETVSGGRPQCRDCSWTNDPFVAYLRAKEHTEETGHSTYIIEVHRTAFERKDRA